MAKTKLPRLTTPRGLLKFPRLTGEADFRFQTESGSFGTKVLNNPDDAGFAAYLKKLDEITEAAFEQMKEENPKHAKKLKMVMPYRNEEDKDGNETGKIEIGYNMKHRVAAKKGPNAGKTYEFRPALFDAAGRPILPDSNIRIGGGTEARVTFEYFPYFNASGAEKTAGISKRLVAVQIIKLVEWSNGNASDYGFEDEDGFDAGEHATANANSGVGSNEDEEETNDTDGADF